MPTQLKSIDGFTLLEMMVVLSIIGLLTAITFPKLGKMVDRVEIATQKDDLTNQLKLLSFKAYQNGRAFSIQQATENSDLLLLPPGWHLIAGAEVFYSAIGVCSGGEVSFQSKTSLISYQLKAPICNPIVL